MLSSAGPTLHCSVKSTGALQQLQHRPELTDFALRCSHTHDHLRLLLDSLAASTSSTTPLALSYDTRSRNVAAETSQPAALASFQDLRRRLEVETEKGLKVPSGRKLKLEAVTPVVVEVESTWAREVRSPLRSHFAARAR